MLPLGSFQVGLKKALPLSAYARPFVAQIQQLKDGFGLALTVLFMFGFIWGIVKIWSGANAIAKGDPDGKAGIVAGVIIAAAASIMAALFAIFGLEDAVIKPRF
ncbi:MAG: hypothetical protein JNG82_11285 [Opitutaceae bacterium]|jgi:hypothetical protein|nr:hypothetical protein [Opitutaceae bacterium]